MEARQIFKGGVPTNILKSSYGLNPYAIRENHIDKNKPTTCPRCGQEETWLHVIQCCARKHETSDWKLEITRKTKKLKESERKGNTKIKMGIQPKISSDFRTSNASLSSSSSPRRAVAVA